MRRPPLTGRCTVRNRYGVPRFPDFRPGVASCAIGMVSPDFAVFAFLKNVLAVAGLVADASGRDPRLVLHDAVPPASAWAIDSAFSQLLSQIEERVDGGRYGTKGVHCKEQLRQ